MKVLKFGALWCNGCLVMKPRWSEIEKENPWLKTEYFDFDKDKKQVSKHGIDSGVLPVFIFLDKNGQELLRLSGEVDKKDLVSTINKYKND